MHKKQFGMYAVIIDEDGALQIQAPTLLKPLKMDARQAQDIAAWLAEVYHITPVSTPNTTAPSTSTTSATPTQTVSEPAVVNEPPETIAQRAIATTIATVQDQFPSSLAPENRDRFIEQVSRHPDIKPLLSQGKISRKQVLLWVEQQLGTNL